MSSYGYFTVQQIERQREFERLRRVQLHCDTLANTIDKNIQNLVAEPGFATFLEDLNAVKKQINSAKSLQKAEPDAALEQLQRSAENVQEFAISIQSKVQKWSFERENAYKNLSNLLDTLTSIPLESSTYQMQMEDLINRVRQANDTAINSSDIHKLILDVEEKAQHIAALDEKESVRKMTVNFIINMLSARGFKINPPKIKDDVVHLHAKMPSGKEVLLQILNNAEIHFDFRNYEGTTCKDELDTILKKLETEGELETCVEQFVWHNPDKIKKGAKDFPYGQTQQRYMK